MRSSVYLRLVLVLGMSAAVLTGCSRDPNVRKQKYFESGQRYYDEGKYREAVIQFLNATQVDSTFAAAHYQLSRSYIKLQDWQHAYMELGRTLELQPDLLEFCSRAHHKVVLQLPAITAINDVNTTIYVPIFDFREGRNVGAPVFRITAEKIIDLSGHLSERVTPCFGIGAE